MLRCRCGVVAAFRNLLTPGMIRTGVLAASAIFVALSQPAAYAQKSLPVEDFNWTRADVTIVARGFGASSSIGKMDSYLALVSTPNHKAAAQPARLVDYYSELQTRIPDESITSGRVLHLRLSYEAYCGMSAEDFTAQRTFDVETLAKLRENKKQQSMPCFIVRRSRRDGF
jgi:hypothetical protein